jgi:WD40 repeat protein
MMKTKLLFTVISYLILSLFISACAQQNQGTPESTSSETGWDQQDTVETTLPAEEVLPTKTVEVELDLSTWSQSSLPVYSSDGSLLAVYGGGIDLYDPASLQQISNIPVTDFGQLSQEEDVLIIDIAFSADSNFISMAYWDISQTLYGVQQLDLATNATTNNSIVLSRADNFAPNQGPHLAMLSPDGETFAIYFKADSVLKLWDVAAGGELHNINISPYDAAFSPDGTTLAIGDATGFQPKVTLWDLSSGNKIRSFDLFKSNNYVYNMKVAYSPDGGVVAVASLYDFPASDIYSMLLIDLDSGNELVSFEVPVIPSMGGNPLFTLAFSNDGKLLATGSAIGIKIWDTTTGEELISIEYAVEKYSFAEYELTFSPDDTKLISASGWNRLMIMWDVATGEKLAP